MNLLCVCEWVEIFGTHILYIAQPYALCPYLPTYYCIMQVKITMQIFEIYSCTCFRFDSIISFSNLIAYHKILTIILTLNIFIIFLTALHWYILRLVVQYKYLLNGDFS